MFKVKIIAVGRTKEAWLEMGIAEYEKRLQGRLALEWLLAKDDKSLFAYCRKEPLLIALDVQGELLSSVGFSEKLTQLGRTAFVIGGPDGLPADILKEARFLWSLSPLTFTNQMARLILVEQLYRALEIASGSPYHK
jgi:23S rRNA (pseudouridine1915-N3)-methyltransferase